MEPAGPFTWRIPPDAMPGMRVPGVIFADDALIERAVSDRAVEQVANVATLPGIVRASYAMPDIHWGYGFPVGGVAATDVEAGGVISPGGVGFDICCGVRLLRSDVPETSARERIGTLTRALASRIPRGVGTKGLRSLSHGELQEVLRDGVEAPLRWGIGWPEDAERCEDRGRLDGADPAQVSDRAHERGMRQLGSLGAGNHFLEIQIVDEVYDPAAAEAFELATGTVCVMVHSGSRGLGHQVCTDALKIFDRLMRRCGIEVPDRQLACGPVRSPEAEAYLASMTAAANFARANRHVMADEVRGVFGEIFEADPRDLGMRLVYDVAHNLAKLERHPLDPPPGQGASATPGGSRMDEGTLLCVHRKGATRAFGPGHPELADRYRDVGQPVIIPGSMGTASYVLAGIAEGRDRAFWSTCHGAGRVMSRTQAKKQMHGRELRAELAQQGVLVDATNWRLLSEEAPYAYKDVSAVVETCEGAGLSRKVARLRPLAVVKG